MLKFSNWNNWYPYTPGHPMWDYQFLHWSRTGVLQLTDIMIRNSQITPAMLKEKNPDIIILRERTLLAKNEWESDSSGWVPSTDYSGLQHPLYLSDIIDNDWWLYDSLGNIVFETANPAIRILDVGRTGFKELFTSRLLAQLRALPGVDGVAFDYWWAHPASLWSGHSVGYRDYSSSANWFETAYRPFVEYWTDAVREAGFIIFANYPGEYDPTWHWSNPEPNPTSDWGEVSMWQRTKVDGANYEVMVTGWSITGYDTGPNVEKRMQSFLLDPLPLVTSGEFHIRPGAEWRGDSFESDLQLNLAMQYLSTPKGKNRYWWVYNQGYAFYHPFFDWDLGEPVEDAPVKEEPFYLWHRDFNSGHVVMNFEEGNMSYTLPEGEFWDVYGQNRSGEITLAAHTALVLRKSMPPPTLVSASYDFEESKRKVDVTLDLLRYPIGGVSISAATFGLATLEEVVFPDNGAYKSDAGILICYWDKTQGKIKVYRQDPTSKLFVDAAKTDCKDVNIKVRGIGF